MQKRWRRKHPRISEGPYKGKIRGRSKCDCSAHIVRRAELLTIKYADAFSSNASAFRQNSGVYRHPRFIRGRPEQCNKVRRKSSKSTATSSDSSKTLSDQTDCQEKPSPRNDITATANFLNDIEGPNADVEIGNPAHNQRSSAADFHLEASSPSPNESLFSPGLIHGSEVAGRNRYDFLCHRFLADGQVQEGKFVGEAKQLFNSLEGHEEDIASIRDEIIRTFREY